VDKEGGGKGTQMGTGEGDAECGVEKNDVEWTYGDFGVFFLNKFGKEYFEQSLWGGTRGAEENETS
jgi:hypothetical protein